MTAESSGVPRSVVTFVTDNIETLDQLELLVLAMESPHKWWDATLGGAAIGIGTGAARQALERLASRNLLAISVIEDVRYRFQPGSEELRRTVQDFATAWRTDRPAITHIVVKGASPALRNFSNAFRIRRDADS